MAGFAVTAEGFQRLVDIPHPEASAADKYLARWLYNEWPAPENILVMGGSQVRIIDFGVSRTGPTSEEWSQRASPEAVNSYEEILKKRVRLVESDGRVTKTAKAN